MAFTGWNRKCELTIQAAQVVSDCTDFPVLLTEATLPSEMFDADGLYPAISGGGDIRFSSDVDGDTQLPCEIVTFTTDNDPANGAAEIWTNITLTSGTDTSIYVWYNKTGETQPSVSGTYGSDNVWNSDYKLVQHMNEDPSGPVPQMIDSTLNSNDGTSGGTMGSNDLVDGQIGQGLNFNGSSNRIEIDNSTSIDISGTNQHLTLSAWIKTAETSIDNDEDIISKWDSAGGERQYRFDIDNSDGDRAKFWLSPNGTSGYAAIGATDIVDGVLHHIVCVYDDVSMTIYVDGSVDSNGASNPLTYSDGINPTNTSELRIAGHIAGGGLYFGGIIDEVRISDIASSAEWIETEYNNQSSPATFVIEGTPESVEETSIPDYGWFATDDAQWFDEDDHQWFPNNYALTISDSFRMNDTCGTGNTITVSANGNFTLNGTCTTLVGYTTTVSDGFSISDTSNANSEIVVSVSDGFTISDTVSGQSQIIGTITENFTISGTASTHKTTTATISDSFVLSDTANTVATFAASISDGFTIGDVCDAGSAIIVSVSDGFGLSDVASTVTNFVATVDDTFTVSDTSNVVANFVTTLSESFSISDAASGVCTVAVSVDDGFVVNDSASGLRTLFGTVYENFKISDVTSKTCNIIVSVSDGLILSDTVNAAAEFIVTVADSFTISEATEGLSDTSIKFTFISEGRTYNFIVKNKNNNFTAESRTTNFISE